MVVSSPKNPSYKQVTVNLSKMFSYALKFPRNSRDMKVLDNGDIEFPLGW